MTGVQSGDDPTGPGDGSGRRTAARGPMRRADRFWAGPVAGLVLLAALAGVYAILSRKPAPKPAPPSLLQVSLDQITALRFASGGKTLVLYAKKGGVLGPLSRTWAVGSASGRAADTTLVGDFLTSLLTLAPIRTVAAHPAPAALHGYGLSPPAAFVTLLRGAQAPVTLNVGAASPVGSYYASVSGKPSVYLIAASLATQVSANPNNWLPIPTTPSTTTPAAPATPPAKPAKAKAKPAKPKAAGTTPAK